MQIQYNKLVRDRIPEIISADGKTCTTEVLSGEDYLRMLDAKLDEARKTVDEDKRVELMHEADAIAAEDMPIIPMLHKTLNKVTSNKFTGIKVDAARLPELRDATPAQ